SKSEDASSKPAASPDKPDGSPKPTPQSGGTNTATATVTQKENVPNYYVSRSGALVFITSTPLTLKSLRPPNGKPLVEDQNFRMAYDRFASESVFAFINVK